MENSMKIIFIFLNPSLSEHGESPSQKQRLRTAKNFWSDIDKKLNLENISSGRRTLEENLDLNSSTKESENAGN